MKSIRQPMHLCSLAGRYDNPTPTQFLVPIDCSKIFAKIPSFPLQYRFSILLFLLSNNKLIFFSNFWLGLLRYYFSSFRWMFTYYFYSLFPGHGFLCPLFKFFSSFTISTPARIIYPSALSGLPPFSTLLIRAWLVLTVKAYWTCFTVP